MKKTIYVLCQFVFLLVWSQVSFAGTTPLFHETFDSLSSITVNGGTYSGIAIVPGLFGNAVDIEGNAALSYDISNFPYADGTLMFWVSPRYSFTDDASHTFVNFISSAPSLGYQYAVTDGWWEPAGSKYFYFIYQPLNASDYSKGPFALWGNKWKFVAVTWRSAGTAQGRHMGLYVNGLPRATADDADFSAAYPDTLPFTAPAGRISFGSDGDGGRNAQSLIDEVSLYDRVLSSSEIDNVYKTYLGSGWDHHRNREWMEPQIDQAYAPKRNVAGKILENRILLDEGAQFYPQGADTVLNKMKAANMNVYMPCLWHGAGARFNSSLEEVQSGYNYFSGGQDPLKELIQKAHGQGIEVHAWFTVGLKHWDKHSEWAPDGTPAGFYDMHNPAFRKYLADLIVEAAQKYDLDGINLDYIRTGDISTSTYCQSDYTTKTGRDLLTDSHTSPFPQALINWQSDAVEALVADVHARVKAIRPSIIISVDGYVLDEVDLKTLSYGKSVYGRNQMHWLTAGLIDIAFDMDYSKQLTVPYIDHAMTLVPSPRNLTKLLGNYDTVNASVVSRDAASLKDLVAYSQRKWPGTVTLYLYSMFSDEQVNALVSGPFSEPAATDWCFVTHKTPPAPAGLTGLTASRTAVQLTWTMPDDPAVTGFNIYRDGVKIGESAAASFIDTGVHPALRYEYSIKACNTLGEESPASDRVIIAVPGDISVPEGKVAVYPVPFIGGRDRKLTFSNLQGRSTIDIFSIEGSRIYSERADTPKFELVPDKLSSGVYLYVIKDTRGTTKGKLMIEK